MADSLVDDFDAVALLSLLADRCVEVLDVSAAGVMLAAPEGDLRVVASPSEARIWPPPAAAGPGSPLWPSTPASAPPTPCPCAFEGR